MITLTSLKQPSEPMGIPLVNYYLYDPINPLIEHDLSLNRHYFVSVDIKLLPLCSLVAIDISDTGR